MVVTLNNLNAWSLQGVIEYINYHHMLPLVSVSHHTNAKRPDLQDLFHCQQTPTKSAYPDITLHSRFRDCSSQAHFYCRD